MGKVYIDGAVYVAEEKVCKYIEALQAENARFKKNYAIIEECSPPDWPRTDFVRHIFNLWSNGVEDENKRLREALENKDSYTKRLERKVARVEKRFDKLLETTEQALSNK